MGEKGEQLAEFAEQGLETAKQNAEGIDEFFGAGASQRDEQAAEISGISINPYLIGGGVLVAYLLLRKKK